MKYKALPVACDITQETVLLQAVRALDCAALAAEKTSDVEGLLNVAAMWMKFTESLDGQVIMEDKSSLFETSIPTGFQSSEKLGGQNDRN